MLRLVVENIILFLLPTVLYVAYGLLRRHLDDGSRKANPSADTQSPGAQSAGADTTDTQPPNANISHVLNDAPFIWLAFLGAGLVFAVLALFGSVSTSNPDGTYEPAVYKDGKIVPGRIK